MLKAVKCLSKLVTHKMYQRVILLFVLGVVVAAGYVRGQQVEKEIEIEIGVTQVTQSMLMKLYNQAEAMINARKTTEAIEKYKSFLAQHPTGPHVPQIKLWMGRAYVWKGEPQQGLIQYKKIIAEYPDFAYMPAVLYEMHLAHAQAKDNENALAKLQQLIDTYPDTHLAAQARFIRGQRYYEQGAYQSAIEAFNKVQIDTKDPFQNLLWRDSALLMIGESHRKLEQYDEAIEAVQQSITAMQAKQQSYEQQGISTEHFGAGKAQTGRILGDTYQDAGRYDEAIAKYNQVIDAYPNDYNTVLALYSKAQLFGEQGKTQKAIETYQQLIAWDANYTERAEKEIALLNQAAGENKAEEAKGGLVR